MFVPPAFAQMVGSTRPSHPARAPRASRRRRRLSLRPAGHATVLTALLLVASAAFASPSFANGLSASEQSMDFGTQSLGTVGPARGVLIYNEGQRGVTLDSLEFTGPDADSFEIETEDCTGDSLSPGSHCILGLRFSPQRGGNLAAALEVSSTAQPDESVGVGLSGIGAAPPPPPVRLDVVKIGDGTGNVTSDYGEIDCGEVCTTSRETGSTVTLTALPAAGSTFAGWSGGGCANEPVCTVSLSADMTVMAFFGQVIPPPTVTPPTPLAGPSVSGHRRVGSRLRCSSGQWSGDGPLAFTYSWTRGGRVVSGAGGTSYRVRRSDRGRRIACRVTARGPGGSASSTSQPVRIRRP